MKRIRLTLLLTILILFQAVSQTNIYIDSNHPNASDSNAGTDPNSPWLTLKTASWNNLNDGSIINIAAGVYTWSTVTITKSIVVQGSAKNEVILQGMSDANFNSKTGTTNKFATINASLVTFKKMTLRNSICTTHGGIFSLLVGSTLNLEDMILERTYVTSSKYGGAISSRGNLNCIDVIFDNNIAMQGGAIYTEIESGTMNFLRCKFTNNTTKEGTTGTKVGGAIYINNASDKINTLSFESCIFDSNESDQAGNGGALAMRLHVAGGQIDVQVNNCAFINNKTYNLGSAIYTNATGTATASSKFSLDVRNTTFSGNKNNDSGSKSGTCINIFSNAGYNSTSQRGTFNLINNTFYDNTNGNTSNVSVYAADPKLDMAMINNIFLDSPDQTAYSLIIQGPAGDIPVYSTVAGRGNVGDRMGGSLFTTAYEGYNWGVTGYRNVNNKYNDEILLGTTPEYNSDSIPYLPVSSSASILVDSGFSTYEINGINIVPPTDIRGQSILGNSKDVGVYEKYPDLKPILDAQTGQSVINIPHGIYELNASSGTLYTFANLSNVTVKGNGSTIICKARTRAFDVSNCVNFTMEDITIDYDPLCFTQGTITWASADSKSWTVRLHEGYPTTNLLQSKLQLFDPVTRLVKKNLFTIQGTEYTMSQSVSDPRDITFSITRSMTAGSVVAGELLVIPLDVPAGMNQHTMFINNSTNFTAKNVTIYGSNMFSIVEHDCDNSHYLNCTITRNPNDPTKTKARLRSGNGDGIHSKHAVKGPTIDSCRIEFNGDDCIAVNGRFYLVYKVDSINNYMYILSKDYNQFRIQPNDKVACVDNDGSVKATVVAEELTNETPTSTEISNCTSLFPTLLSPTTYLTARRVRLSGWPASGLSVGDYVYSENRIGEGFSITNNTVGHTRARGIFVKSSDGVIKNNTVEGTQLAGIVLAPEINWAEAGCSNNVEVSNNTIRNCVFASSHPGMVQPAALCVISLNAANQISPNGASNNISVFNNTIEDCPRPAVVVTSTNNLYYHHNTINNNPSIVRTHGSTYGVVNTVDLWTQNVVGLDTAILISVSGSSVPDMSALIGDSISDTISVNGTNLIANIALTITGTNADQFTVSPTSITPSAGKVENVPVIITYSPKTLGAHTATLRLNSTDATEITRSLNGSFNSSDQIGKPLPAWKLGQMDIYQINTGRGENYFMIMPDSTSMLMDVGDINVDQYSNPQRPDTTRSAGEWVARFVQGVNPKNSDIDYMFNTHFHPDHFGAYGVTNSVLSTDKGTLNYKPTGISRTGDFLNMRKFIDRGYPNYNQPQNVSAYQDIANYSKFVKWKVQTAGSEAEQFEVGSDSQFTLKYKPGDFPAFKVQNLFANGVVWTGSGKNVIDYVHKNDSNYKKVDSNGKVIAISDNTLSCGVKINYGNFTYYTGGDIYGTLLDENDLSVSMESAIKNIIGEVDVCKANHHCFTGTMTSDFVNIISAKIYLLSYINSKHLKTAVLDNLVANPKNGDSCLMVPTYLSDSQRASLTSLSYYDQITASGHAVVRVINGGANYLLYILNDEDELKTVEAVYGPFVSKAQTNIYIDSDHPNASDSNAGTDPNAPWLTLKTSTWNNLNDGSTINIAAGTYTWTSTTISKNLTVQGSSKEEVILQGMTDSNFNSKTGTNSRLATINAPLVTFKKMTLRNSIHPSGTNGGIFYINLDKTLNLEDVILERTYGVGRYGGAISSRGNVNCTDVIFNTNTAMQGGAVFAETESGYYNFQRCKFINNTTNEGTTGYKFGGAVYLNNASGKVNILDFDQCVFDSNESDDYTSGLGGAIGMRLNVAGGKVYANINNSAFINNKTYGLGSAVYTGATGTASSAAKFSLNVSNTTFSGNQNDNASSADNKKGTCLNIFNNSGYNTTSKRGTLNLVNNTFFNNTNGNTANKSVYLADPKLDVAIINNVFLDSPDQTAYSLFIEGPSGDIPVYSTIAGRGNVGDRIGGSLFTTAYEGYNWGGTGYGNLNNKYNDEILLGTTPEYNSDSIPYLPISSSASILVDSGFSTYEVNGINIVPQIDICGQGIVSTSKDVGVYEYSSSPMGAPAIGILNEEIELEIFVYRNADNKIAFECRGDLNDNAFVWVFNSIGQKVTGRNFTNTITVIDSTLQSGLYIVVVRNGTKTITRRITIL